MQYQALCKALELLGLGERASLEQIKARYRQLAKQLHPDADSAAANGEEGMRQLNAAYALVRSYCEGYRFCFNEEEFYEQNPEERLRRQFATDPLWGKGDKEE